MKESDHSWRPYYSRSTILKSLKICLCLFILTSIQAFPRKLEAQNSSFSLEMKRKAIKDVFKAIEQNSNYVFLFTEEVSKDVDKIVSIKVQSKPLNELLDELFSNTNLVYKIVDRQVLVSGKVKSVAKQQKVEDIQQPKPKPMVSGQVLDGDGKPLAGVSVAIKGTNLGTLTDGSGYYSLALEEDKSSLLVFSFVGYEPQERSVNKTTKLDVRLVLKDNSFDDVVVVAYGTSKVKDLTGSLSHLGAKEIELSSAGSSLQSLLQGRAPNVNVTIQSASPTSPINVIIRGVSTLSGNTQPLWVIDGVPDYSQNYSGDIENTLYNLNIADIESIDILRDVSATALYGSRGANGVIIVTTKRGKLSDKYQIDFSMRVGTQIVNSNKIKPMNVDEYKRFAEVVGKQTIFANGAFDYNTRFFFDEAKFNTLTTSQWDTNSLQLKSDAFMGGDTNWWDEMTQNALLQEYNVSIRGGSNSSTYFVSGGYRDQDGIVKGGYSRLFTGRANIETQIAKNLNLGLNISGSSRESEDKDKIIESIIRFRPDYKAYNDDGSLNQISTTIENPQLTLENRNAGEGKTFVGTVSLNWNVIDGLSFTSKGTVNYSQSIRDLFYKKGTRGYSGQYNSRTITTSDYTTQVWENLLNYNKKIGVHELSAMFGNTLEKYTSRYVSSGAEDFPNEIELIDLGSGSDSWASDDKRTNTLVSVIGRLNYKLNGKYLATVTFREDGSSKFGSGKKWGFFPSAALGWLISEESFMEPIHEQIPYLKLRTSYGRIGSQNLLGEYDWLSTIGTGVYDGQSGIRPATLGNPKLQWEETKSVDVGLDFGIINDRIRGTIGYYDKSVTNLIYYGAVPANSSFSSFNQNIGKINNRGWEFNINAEVFRANDMSLDLGFNIATNKGKVVKLDGINTDLKLPYYYEYINLREGGEIGEWWGYKYAGRLFVTQEEIYALKPVNPQTGAQTSYRLSNDMAGDLYLMDLDGNGIINTQDKTVLGNYNPKFFGGFNISYQWKNLFVSALFNYSYGAKRLLYYQYDITYALGTYNVYNNAFDSYNFVGDNAFYPRLSYATGSMTINDSFIHDASYLRLGTLNVNYRLPNKWIAKTGLKDVNLSFQATNLFTITQYPGFDPQGNFGTTSTSYGANDAITVARGVDYSKYPAARSFNLGIKFSFQ